MDTIIAITQLVAIVTMSIGITRAWQAVREEMAHRAVAR